MDTKSVKISDELQVRSGQKEFEEAVMASLDMSLWDMGHDLTAIYDHIGNKVVHAVRQEEAVSQKFREEILYRQKIERPELPFFGIQNFEQEQIEKAHRGLLFNGGVTAVDATRVTHDTLPITITQIGVCLVGYNGNYGSYAHRLFRRDIHFKGEVTEDDIWNLLEIRKGRGGQGQEEGSGRFSDLSQRGLMAFAERSILLDKTDSSWRMGHGHPFPYELLVNFWASNFEITQKVLTLFERIIKYQRFIYIPSSPPRHLVMVGNALEPGEYLIIQTVKNNILNLIEEGKAHPKIKAIQKDFFNEHGDSVVVGLFRSSPYAPAHVFYAHRDFARTAALIAIADGTLQLHRGFPMLIDLADQICYSTFHPETFFASIRQAYAEAGQPFRFLGERETRNR